MLKTKQDIMKDLFESSSKFAFLGLDMETGGLNDATMTSDSRIPKDMCGSMFYPILEISCIMYNGQFKKIGDPITFIIYQDKELLESRVSDWSKEQFKNTLMIQCPESDISLSKADELISDYIKSFNFQSDVSVYMVGNSIRLDMDFLSAQMPKSKELLSYRLLDVTSLKVLFSCLFGSFAKFDKKETHEAQTDIEESMAELAFYKKHFILSQETFVRQSLDLKDQSLIAKNI